MNNLLRIKSFTKLTINLSTDDLAISFFVDNYRRIKSVSNMLIKFVGNNILSMDKISAIFYVFLVLILSRKTLHFKSGNVVHKS